MQKKIKFFLKMNIFVLLPLAAIFFTAGFGSSPTDVTKGNGSDWHQWRGPNRDGISFEKGISKQWPEKGPDVLWRTSVGDGFSGISISDGRLFTMWDEGDSQFLFCLDAQNGKEIWRFKIGDNFRNGYGNGPRSTPVVDGTVVYVVSTKGVLRAFNAADGKVFWSSDLAATYGSQALAYGYSSSPLVEGDKLFVATGGKNEYAFVALNKKTGALMWHSQTDEPSYSSPIAITINKTRQIVFLSGEGLFSVSPDDGSLFWQYQWKARCPSTGIPVNVITPVFIAPDKIFISGGFGTITGALVVQLRDQKNQFTAEKLWKSNEMKNLVSSSVFIKNHIYGFDDNILKCIDALTGEEKWKTRGFQRGNLIAADGLLFVLGERGNLALVEAIPESYKEIASVKMLKGDRCWTSPSLSEGKLYLRNHKEMVCLDIAAD